jgi:hypothetical protein
MLVLGATALHIMNSLCYNYFDALPTDLEHKILGVVCLVIQRNWRCVLAQKNVATQLAQDIVQEAIDDTAAYHLIPAYIEPARISNTQVIEFCEKALRGKKITNNIDMWVQFANMIRFGLDVDQYTGGPGAKWYNRTEEAFLVLADAIYEGLSPDQKPSAHTWFG